MISIFRTIARRMGAGPAWRGGPKDIVLSLYDDGTITDISPSAADILGVEGPIAGRSIFDFVARDDRKRLQDALKIAAKAEKQDDGRAYSQTAFRLLRARRASSMAEIALAPLGRGRLRALIRDQRQAPGELADEFQKPGDGQSPGPAAGVLADLSHEIKTPLNAIMGFADAMRSETYGPLGSEKYKEYANFIHSSGAHMMALIGTILDSAKIEAGRYSLAPVLCAPGPVAKECAEMIRAECERAGLELKISIAENLPETMLDARAVKQILINLLTNAVKFTEDGEIELRVEEKCGAIDFTVRDTGIGMNQVMLAKLGGRFSDTHQNGVRGTDGAGLGLSLAFSLAKLHGGALKLTSMPAEGTCARFTLPVRKTQIDPAANGQYLAAGASGDVQSQLDRVAQYRRDRARRANAA